MGRSLPRASPSVGERLGERQGTLARKVEWLRAYLAEALRSTGTSKVKGQVLTVLLRQAPVSCEVVDAAAVPAEFKREVVEVKVDRNAIIGQFKQTGEAVPGVQMVSDRQYVQIL